MAVGGRPVLALHPADGRVRVHLVVPEARREADLTAAPSAALACLDDAARRGGGAPEEARSSLAAALAEAVAAAGAWAPAEPVAPLAALGGAGFPLLGAAYERGAAPVARVPPWAVPVVAAPDGRGAARAAFGDGATRPVVRALAATLAGPGDGAPVGLAGLGLALAGAQILDPDRLVRVLGSAPADGSVPSVDDLAACRVVVRALGPRRGERVLVDAAAEGGLGRLGDVARVWPDVVDRFPARLPSRLAELRDLCRSLVVTDPGPLPPPPRRRATRPVRPTPPTAGRAAPSRGRARSPQPGLVDLGDDLVSGAAAVRRRPVAAPAPPRGADHGGLRAPVVGAPLPPTTAVPASLRLARLDGCEVEGVRLSRPRTCGDLERWGRMLSSCVGSFGPAAVAGASELVAVHRGLELCGCLELTPGGTVRQLLGPANRSLDAATRRVVLRLLVDPGGIDPRAPGNRGWYPPG